MDLAKPKHLHQYVRYYILQYTHIITVQSDTRICHRDLQRGRFFLLKTVLFPSQKSSATQGYHQSSAEVFDTCLYLLRGIIDSKLCNTDVYLTSQWGIVLLNRNLHVRVSEELVVESIRDEIL